MTVHFANILTYHYFDKVEFQRKINVDGFLLQLAILFVKFKWVKKKSGLIFHETIRKENYFYLIASETVPLHNFLVLPFWSHCDDIALNQEILDTIKPYENVVIGISSPKQDVLSELLTVKFPNKNFYCLGAAVYTSSVFNTELLINTLGTMLFSQPKRTVIKIFKSVIPFLLAITINRKKIKTFFSYL